MNHYDVTGMSCAACEARVQRVVSNLPGVDACTVSLLTHSMSVEGAASPDAVIAAVEKAGYGASLHTDEAPSDPVGAAHAETKKLRRRLIASLVFLMALMYITMGHGMLGLPLPPFVPHDLVVLASVQLALAAAVMAVNHKFFVSGTKSLFSGAPNMDTLVALGSAVSFGWSVYGLIRLCGLSDPEAAMRLYHHELYFESAAMIPALITVGKLLESISKGRTTGALKALMKLKPTTARLLRDGQETPVPAEQVRPGDVFAVKPGDAVPVDGVVLDGAGSVDESALTGESVPVDKAAGDPVSAATINRFGYLTCRATQVGEDTTISRIIRMVADAAATKAPIARIADRVSAVFVPSVIALAALVIAGWLLGGADVAFALARGICVLVISCPCALGLATPVAIMVGSGLGARHGILIKSGEALETVGRVTTVVLDKTGTVTEGVPAVTDIRPADGVTEQELLLTAAAPEVKSEHPLARAIVAESERRGLRPPDAADFAAAPGNGVQATVNGAAVCVGNRDFIKPLTGASPLFADGDELAGQGKTPLYVAQGGRLLGLIAVSDGLKPTSKDAIAAMKALGLRVVMLTGDHEKTAQYIGRQVGADEVIAHVLPDEKEAVIRSLQKDGKVAMVGDGVNDAPALARADVGLAIGAGTDVAIDSASIVLVRSDLADVAACVRLGRGTLRNIRENLFWAFFYNLLCIPLAAGLFGLAMSPMIAAAAMSLSSVTVCLNALRLNRLHLRFNQ